MSAGVEPVVSGLRVWTRDHDLHLWAAVELLIAHGVWLDRSDFRASCVRRAVTPEYGLDWLWIDWRAARAVFDADGFAPASSTELAVLGLAITLAEDRYRLSRMGPANGRLIGAAVTASVGGNGATR